jgi:glutaconate CoA-transferase subunit A
LKVGSNLTSIAEAISTIKDGDVVFVGGYFHYRHPMAAAREIIRQGKKNLTVIAPLSGMEADILIGAGCVSKIIFGFLSLDIFGMAPSFRRKVESGEVEHSDYGDLALMRAIEAAQRKVGHIATRAWIGSDMIAHHPGQLVEVFGEKLLAVPALQPDVALVHAQWADTEGNLVIEGESYDVEAVKAAKRTIATVERLISPLEMRRLGKNVIPRYKIEHLVEQPYGAHPTSCFPFYAHDVRHILEYAEAAQTQEGLDAYLDRYVHGPQSNEAYLEAAADVERLIKLERIMSEGIRYIREKEKVASNG